MIQIFISHSSKDKDLTGLLILLLRLSLGFTSDEIRSTSNDGYQPESGRDPDKELLREAAEAELMIALLTLDSMASLDVANELETRRREGKWLIYLCARGVSPAEVGRKGWKSYAMDATASGQLHHLLEDIAGGFDRPLDRTSSYAELVNELAYASTPPGKQEEGDVGITLLDRLSDESVTLLTVAFNSQTKEIHWQEIMAGLLLYVDGEKMFEPEDKQSEALWRRAVSELEREDLIEEYQSGSVTRSGAGRVFNLTPRGYEIAKSILAQT